VDENEKDFFNEFKQEGFKTWAARKLVEEK
jgi:hypothetical protein